MNYTIAVAGKGGVGKTSICAILIDHLVRSGRKPVLAVDADANSNLYEALGVEEPLSIGEIREEIASAESAANNPIPQGMTKQEFADIRFEKALVEGEDFDLLAMGRSQGKGCYCYINNVLREQLNRYYKNYASVVVDNEAGLEHISRGILPPVNLFLLVSDASRRGIQAAGRCSAMIRDLKLDVQDVRLIVNRALSGEIDPSLKEEIASLGMNLLGVLPADDAVYRFDAVGRPLVQLPESSPFRKSLSVLLSQVL